MPTPFSAMARLASALGEVRASDEQGVEDFYIHVFPAFSEEIREEMFGWLSTLDREPTSEELKSFVSSLRRRPDFEIRRTDIVSGVAEPLDILEE